jgi:hypothetical protein
MYDELVKRLRYAAQWADKGLVIAPSIFLEAADAIEELLSERDEVNADSWKTAFEIERDEHRWIPVTEEPPLKVGDDGYNGYLVYANGYYEVADYTTDKFDNVPYFHVNGEYEPDVTHYMPLPEPPKEG